MYFFCLRSLSAEHLAFDVIFCLSADCESMSRPFRLNNNTNSVSLLRAYKRGAQRSTSNQIKIVCTWVQLLSRVSSKNSQRRKLISSQRKYCWIKSHQRFKLKWNYKWKVERRQCQAKMKMSALLVAMSVGASIVIAGPDDSEPLRANIDEHAGKINKRTTFMRKCRARTRGIASKTVEFGKEIAFKTANATANITDRIGNKISTLKPWLHIVRHNSL